MRGAREMLKDVAALVAAFFMLALSGPASANPPIEAFGNLPAISPPSLSPDGKHFATIQQVNGRPAAVIYAVNAPGVKPTIVPSENAVINGVTWVNNQRLIVTVKLAKTNYAGQYTAVRAFLVNADGSDVKLLGRHEADYYKINYSGGAILDLDADNPNYVYFEVVEPSALNACYCIDVHRIDVTTGEVRRMGYGLPQTADWLMDGHGHIAARMDYSYTDMTLHVKVPDGGDWRDVTQLDLSAKGDTSILGLSENGNALLLVKSTTGHAAVYPLDIKTGKLGAAIFDNPNYDVGPGIYSRSGRVIGAAFEDDKVEYHYFNPERQALQAGLEKAFPDTSVVATSTNAALNVAIVATETPKNGINYYYLDRTTHQAQPIISAYPQLAAADLGEMKPYTFKARDGLTIPGYLTLPPNKIAKNLPLVVLPHGGPHARSVEGFAWYVQFLANRGYAVFEPNFRGSTGYGKAFMEKGFRQWGRTMQDDVTDGVKALIADGTADPNRVCIAGISYGGYAALAGAAFTPELYKCAISIAGVSDVRQMIKTDMAGMNSVSPLASHIEAQIGDSSSDQAYLDAISPALHADQIRIPVLLMHGKSDATVQFSQSEEMRDALIRAGHPPIFVSFEGDDHAISLATTRVEILKNMEAFLDKNIGH